MQSNIFRKENCSVNGLSFFRTEFRAGLKTEELLDFFEGVAAFPLEGLGIFQEDVRVLFEQIAFIKPYK